MKINSFGYWNLKYYLILRSPKSAAHVIFAISLMGTLILVSVHNILTLPLPCLFGEVKLCQAGLYSTGMGETLWDITCNIL